jgi:hypothetical protein
MMSTLYLWIHEELIYMKRGGGTRFNDDTNISTLPLGGFGSALQSLTIILKSTQRSF